MFFLQISACQPISGPSVTGTTGLDMTRSGTAHFFQSPDIAASPRCDTVVLSRLDGLSAEGTALEACYVGGQLQMVKVIVFGCSGRSEFNFSNGNDTHVRVKELNFRYAKSIGGINTAHDVLLTDTSEYFISAVPSHEADQGQRPAEEIYRTVRKVVLPFL